MNLNRRHWLKIAGSCAVAAHRDHLNASDAERQVPLVREFERPMFDFPNRLKTPVKIESIEMLKRDSNYFIRTRSTDGAIGLTGTKQVSDFLPIFERLVAPRFLGRDARELESLIDEVYRANYKLAGLAFWCPVAYVEQSLLDLLGKTFDQSVGSLLGGVIHHSIPVYLSGSDRVLTAEEEVDVYVRGVVETGARAVKFKIGGRMSRNLDAYPGRTERLLRLAREKLGEGIQLYADANGSYDAAKSIEIGRLLENLHFSFFEEPCPYEELSETRSVAEKLRIPIAFGEQNHSLWQFHWILENRVAHILQPDINYNGGLIRAKRVARIAEKFGRTIVPHNTQTGHTSVNLLQFASCTRNQGAFMEYPWRALQKSASWYQPDFRIQNGRIRVPDTPGMGVAFDPDYIRGATVIARIVSPA